MLNAPSPIYIPNVAISLSAVRPGRANMDTPKNDESSAVLNTPSPVCVPNVAISLSAVHPFGVNMVTPKNDGANDEMKPSFGFEAASRGAHQISNLKSSGGFEAANPNRMSALDYCVQTFGCDPSTDRVWMNALTTDIFPIRALDMFDFNTKLFDIARNCRGPLLSNVKAEAYLKITNFTREHYPIYHVVNSNPKILAGVYIDSNLITNNHNAETGAWMRSVAFRNADQPDIVIDYGDYSAQQHVKILPTDLEDALREHMREQASVVLSPDVDLLSTDKHESVALINLLSINESGLKLLSDPDVILKCARTPVYFDAFTHFKNEHLFNAVRSRCTIDYALFQTLSRTESMFVSKKMAITEMSPFVFRLDNPLCEFTDISPEVQDRILSFVTFGISDMINYNRGAYLSGSMISAAIQFIKNRDLFLLESNYPRVYTDFSDCTSREMYDIVRAYAASLSISNATAEFEVKSDTEVSAFFDFDPSKSNRVDIFHKYIGCSLPSTTRQKMEELRKKCMAGSFLFTLKPGCDIDVPVDSTDDVNIRMVAMELLEKMNAKWPGTVLTIVTENRKTPMYRITTDNMNHRINGFRDVEIYPAADPRSQIAGYHVNAVRGWKGPLPGIYVTASAMVGHSFMETTNHNYFAGKDKPWRIIDKYATRGFTPHLGNQYRELRRKVSISEPDPSHDNSFTGVTSSIGLNGKFCILAHHIRDPESAKVTGVTYEFPELEEVWETYEERCQRIFREQYPIDSSLLRASQEL